MLFIQHWQNPQALSLIVLVMLCAQCYLAMLLWKRFRARALSQKLLAQTPLPPARPFLVRVVTAHSLVFAISVAITLLIQHYTSLTAFIFLVLINIALLLGLRHYTDYQIRRRSLIPAVPEENLQRIRVNSATGMRHLHPVFMAGFLCLMILALMMPQGQEQATHFERVPFQVIVLLDLSQSMNAADVLPTRLEAAKDEVISLLSRNSHDEVGLIFFTNDTFVRSPLTVDHSTVNAFLRAAHTEIMPGHGTDFDRALRVAVEAFRIPSNEIGLGTHVRRIVLATDGEDHGQSLQETIKMIRRHRIQVDVMGFGTEAGAPVMARSGAPLYYDNAPVISRYVSAPLASIAEATGGIYLHYGTPEAAAKALTHAWDILRVTMQPSKTVALVQRTNLYPYFLIPAFILAIGYAVYPLFSIIIAQLQQRRRRKQHTTPENRP
ncbi:MAG: VWA domain-containing protein [Proteobacteria bacterium]|nr:VWA domain-containing protein [Pseudomonadota bacterium]